MSKWVFAAVGAVLLAILLEILVTFDTLPVLIELNPAAVEMWKVALDFMAKMGWPLVVTTVLLFAPQIRTLIPRLLKLEETPIGS